jgi:hypothetical protein
MLRKGLGRIIPAGMMVVLLPFALWADCEVSNPETLFPIVRDAPGVSVSGQLAIYYDVVGNVLGCGLDQVNMSFVFRLQRGAEGTPAGFAGSLRDVCYEDSQTQIATVMQLVQNSVVPYFFPTKGKKLPPVQLADVSQIVQDGQTQFAPPYFFLMNVEFRVDAKKAS